MLLVQQIFSYCMIFTIANAYSKGEHFKEFIEFVEREGDLFDQHSPSDSIVMSNEVYPEALNNIV